MNGKIRSTLVLVGMVLLVGFPGTSAFAQAAPTVRTMHITGEIAKAEQGYIIRGEKPAEIFTILNPCPKLEKFMGEGKTAEIDVRIVSGDNVEIETINGKNYGKGCK